MVRITRVGERPEVVFGYAAAHIMSFLGDELEYTTGKTVDVSRRIAPVYNNAKYPAWSHMPHAMETHGKLKKSINKSKVKVGKLTLDTSIFSNIYYAGYVERGFMHSRSHRRVHGRHYIDVPLRVVHQRLFPKRTKLAFIKAFKGD